MNANLQTTQQNRELALIQETQLAETKRTMRKNEIRLVKEKFKKNAHNAHLIEGIMKAIYLLDDSVANWAFLGINILEIKGNIESARYIDIDNREAYNRLAMAKSFEKYKEMKDLFSAQRTLLEAANASP